MRRKQRRGRATLGERIQCWLTTQEKREFRGDFTLCFTPLAMVQSRTISRMGLTSLKPLSVDFGRQGRGVVLLHNHRWRQWTQFVAQFRGGKPWYTCKVCTDQCCGEFPSRPTPRVPLGNNTIPEQTATGTSLRREPSAKKVF